MIIMECPGLLRVMVPKLSTPTGKQKTKSVVNTPGLRKHLYSLRLGYVMDVSEEVHPCVDVLIQKSYVIFYVVRRLAFSGKQGSHPLLR